MFFSLKNNKGSRVEAYLEGKFTQKYQDQRYAIYLLSEQQGRGTDLKTCQDIEFSGGNYLVISDVFSKRSQEQIIGRVGRLKNKGSYRNIIYIQGSKETVD
jgi:hypothetical protein